MVPKIQEMSSKVGEIWRYLFILVASVQQPSFLPSSVLFLPANHQETIPRKFIFSCLHPQRAAFKKKKETKHKRWRLRNQGRGVIKEGGGQNWKHDNINNKG
jgi:hypothetical protein